MIGAGMGAPHIINVSSDLQIPTLPKANSSTKQDMAANYMQQSNQPGSNTGTAKQQTPAQSGLFNQVQAVLGSQNSKSKINTR